jgi:hypothetical protein
MIKKVVNMIFIVIRFMTLKRNQMFINLEVIYN